MNDTVKLNYLTGGGYVTATIFQATDMMVDTTKTAYTVEAIMNPSEGIDAQINSKQVDAFRITETRKNSSSVTIAVIKTISLTAPDWLADVMGYQEFSAVADPSSSLAQDYTFKLTINEIAVDEGNDITITLGASETFANIALAINTVVNAFVTEPIIAAEKNSDSGKVRISSLTGGDNSKVLISEPDAGSSLITLLTNVDAAVDGISILAQLID
jgi:hypothetical protein